MDSIPNAWGGICHTELKHVPGFITDQLGAILVSTECNDNISN